MSRYDIVYVDPEAESHHTHRHVERLRLRSQADGGEIGIDTEAVVKLIERGDAVYVAVPDGVDRLVWPVRCVNCARTILPLSLTNPPSISEPARIPFVEGPDEHV